MLQQYCAFYICMYQEIIEGFKQILKKYIYHDKHDSFFTPSCLHVKLYFFFIDTVYQKNFT